MIDMDLSYYDKWIVSFSGGKDSIALFLHLLELGIPKEKIELWHCLVDGKCDKQFMDWEVTEDYCRKFAQHFDVPIFFAWKEGGFKREMYRENSLTAPTSFELPDGTIKTVGGERGKPSTRRKFPQVSQDLNVRWCSAYLKIDVCSAAIRNQERFSGCKTAILSGERGEESPARAKYAMQEPDRSDLRNGKLARYVDRLRLIRDWTEEMVWEIIQRHMVIVHPCYYLGWSRCSCKFCIFGNADQFRSGFDISPNQGNDLISVESEFNVTLKRKKSISQLVNEGTPYPSIGDHMSMMATSHQYHGQIVADEWLLPAGAFKEGCGPT